MTGLRPRRPLEEELQDEIDELREQLERARVRIAELQAERYQLDTLLARAYRDG